MFSYCILLLVGFTAACYEEAPCRKSCQCERGCGPGFEQSYLGYGGKFDGGARKFLPVYERTVSTEHECVVKGGRGAQPGQGDCGCYRHKRSHDLGRHQQPCRCECGCGPGFEQSYLGYGGKFHGGARKFLPVYERTVSTEHGCIVKGGRGAQPGQGDCGCYRHKRSYDLGSGHGCGYQRQPCRCECGCGPGFEQSYLGYGGKFHGGARKFLPVYERTVSAEQECIVKGGRGAQPGQGDCECYRHKRSSGFRKGCKCECGCGPGFEKSYLTYGGSFKGGSRRMLPVFQKTISAEQECTVKGGRSGGASHSSEKYKPKNRWDFKDYDY